jgi:hypothetical protein
MTQNFALACRARSAGRGGRDARESTRTRQPHTRNIDTTHHAKSGDGLELADAVQLDDGNNTCNLPICEIRMACSLERRRMIGIKDERRGHRSAAAQLSRARNARCRGRRQRATARCSSCWAVRWWLAPRVLRAQKYKLTARAEVSEH